MDKNKLKDYLTKLYLAEEKGHPGLTTSSKISGSNTKINKDAVKSSDKNIQAFKKTDNKPTEPVKFNYTNKSDKTYHDEMEILNGMEMLQYDIEPSETFKKRAEEGIVGSQRMGNNPKNDGTATPEFGGDPEFGKKLVKRIKDSQKKREEQTPETTSFGDDWEITGKKSKSNLAISEAVVKPISEKNKIVLGNWIEKMGLEDASVKLIDSVSQTKMISSLPDSNEYGDGLNKVISLMTKKDFDNAYAVAKKLATKLENKAMRSLDENQDEQVADLKEISEDEAKVLWGNGIYIYIQTEDGGLDTSHNLLMFKKGIIDGSLNMHLGGRHPKEVQLDEILEWLKERVNTLKFYTLNSTEGYQIEAGKMISEGRTTELGKGYTHFAIDKASNKIVNGWEYKNLDKESILEYSKTDLKDMFPERKLSEFSIIGRNNLIKKGLDPTNTNDWHKYDETKVGIFRGINKIEEMGDLKNNYVSIHLAGTEEDEEELVFAVFNKNKIIKNGFGDAASAEKWAKQNGYKIQKQENIMENTELKPGAYVTLKKAMDKSKKYQIQSQEGDYLTVKDENDDIFKYNLSEISPVLNEQMKRLNFKQPFNGFGNALKLIPEHYRVDNKVFEMTDGNESYKIRWEGTLTEGKAVILLASDKKMISEEVNKMKHLFNYKSKDTLGIVTGRSRVNEDAVFTDIWNKSKKLVVESEDMEDADAEEVESDEVTKTQAPEAKEHTEGTAKQTIGTTVPKPKEVAANEVTVKYAPEAKQHIKGASTETVSTTDASTEEIN